MSKRKEDTSSIVTQTIFSFIGFDNMLRIESIHHQAFIYTANSRYNVTTSTDSIFVAFFCISNDDTRFSFRKLQHNGMCAIKLIHIRAI